MGTIWAPSYADKAYSKIHLPTTGRQNIHCLKGVRIRSFSGLYFSAFGLNTQRQGVSLRIQSECRKIRTRKTPNTDTFYAVITLPLIRRLYHFNMRKKQNKSYSIFSMIYIPNMRQQNLNLNVAKKIQSFQIRCYTKSSYHTLQKVDRLSTCTQKQNMPTH